MNWGLNWALIVTSSAGTVKEYFVDAGVVTSPVSGSLTSSVWVTFTFVPSTLVTNDSGKLWNGSAETFSSSSVLGLK